MSYIIAIILPDNERDTAINMFRTLKQCADGNQPAMHNLRDNLKKAQVQLKTTDNAKPTRSSRGPDQEEKQNG